MTEAATTITPTELATELEVDPKRLRGYLRANFARPKSDKGKAWSLDEATADACREHFTPAEDDSSDTDEA